MVELKQSASPGRGQPYPFPPADPSPPRPRIAVVSPFIDKQHGTERQMAEILERLAADFEFHLYSERVRDLDLSRIHWHRVPGIPGPHLLRYIWWFFINPLCRWWDRVVRKLRFDLVLSPGINCLDADVVMIHAVFAELRRAVGAEMSLTRNPVSAWPRLVHQRIYYRLIESLERRVYPHRSLEIGVVSTQVVEELRRYFGRQDRVRVIPNGVDESVFHPEAVIARRGESRREFGLQDHEFALLLIGNGWQNKGLGYLLRALGPAGVMPWRLLVVGDDNPATFRRLAETLGIADRVRFLPPSPDVVQFYAAADLYVGPSLHDSFALPMVEAMAVGLPVITSSKNGGSSAMTHNVDGLVLQDPRDTPTLTAMILELYYNPDLRRRIGENAARTMQKLTWKSNAESMKSLIQDALARKARAAK